MQYIKLSALDSIISGEYSPGDSDIFVELDSSISSFTVNLPDLSDWNKRVFNFKNFGPNAVTLQTKNGQIIDYSGVTSVVLNYKNFIALFSNGRDKIISLETNP